MTVIYEMKPAKDPSLPNSAETCFFYRCSRRPACASNLPENFPLSIPATPWDVSRTCPTTGRIPLCTPVCFSFFSLTYPTTYPIHVYHHVTRPIPGRVLGLSRSISFKASLVCPGACPGMNTQHAPRYIASGVTTGRDRCPARRRASEVVLGRPSWPSEVQGDGGSG